MDVLICDTDSASKLVSNAVLAMKAKESGREVGLLFTEAGLVALCQGVFDWPLQLCGQAMRLAMADNCPSLGLPTKGGKGEARQMDPRQIVTRAIQAGVPVFASEFWVSLTGLRSKLPQGVKVLDKEICAGPTANL